jgi:hypothetical protein
VALGAATAAPALPDRHPRDPREAFTAADQAWAKRIALKRSDLPGGAWRALRPPPDDGTRCSSFDPDRSDLTLTGRAESKRFEREPVFVASQVEIFRTAREAAIAFRRGATPQVIRCFDELIGDFPAQWKGRLVSGRVVAAPPVGQRRFAVRLVWEVTPAGTRARLYFDVFGWDRGRASTTVILSTFGPRPDRALELRIAKRIDSRMQH